MGAYVLIHCSRAGRAHCDTFMSLRQNFSCFTAPPSCMCMYGFYWSNENVKQRVRPWRRVFKAALCDSVRNFILKASVFCYTIVLSLLCQKCDILCPLFTFMMSFWCKSFGFSPVVLAVGVLYWNNRWLQTYHGTCSFSNNPSLFREKNDHLDTSNLFSKSIFTMTSNGFLVLWCDYKPFTGTSLPYLNWNFLVLTSFVTPFLSPQYFVSLTLFTHSLSALSCMLISCILLRSYPHLYLFLFHRRTISLRSLIIWVADNSLSRGKSCDP